MEANVCAYFDDFDDYVNDGLVPFVDKSIYEQICLDEVVGQVPSDAPDKYTEHVMDTPPVLPEVVSKSSSALVFIEELAEDPEPVARPLGRFGTQSRNPTAVIGLVRRLSFCGKVKVLSYVDSQLGDDFLASWKDRSEFVSIRTFPQPDDVREFVQDTADDELPKSQANEPDFPVHRKTVTHLAHAIGRLRAGLMRFHVLAFGNHPMMDGSYGVVKARFCGCQCGAPA
jgi:hypothetical protein